MFETLSKVYVYAVLSDAEDIFLARIKRGEAKLRSGTTKPASAHKCIHDFFHK